MTLIKKVFQKDSPEIFFNWIPKTAGTSVFRALEKEASMIVLNRSIEEVRTFQNKGSVTFGHFHYGSLMTSEIVSQEYDKRAFKFSIVRNPYDRALSLYFYFYKWRHHPHKNVYGFSGTLIEFLERVYRNRPPIGMYNVFGMSQANPQSDWLFNDEETFIVDKIFRYENIDEIEQYFKKQFGFRNFSLGHENKTERSAADEEALRSHPEIIPLIEYIYARDFDVLGYARMKS